ncbi:putative gamma-glutamylcyclotransferase CG2811 [Styela clava]|uniref:putative gamma-glutamylcyclotransferase CG2811 n=1 Tax=Styela clava TaxID=7725 RepID=UPI001939770E|nr:putative gamma-glutamylcyclotransferase CG2811 [Styela clava]
MYRIFVYGTLKRGMPNHSLIEDVQNGKAVYVANGTMAEKYPMVVEPNFGIPFLLDNPGEGKNVEGEVWDVDSNMLKKLDGIEMHPDWYTRFEKDIVVKDEAAESNKSAIIKCWTYILCDFSPKLTTYKYLSTYTNEDVVYIPPNERFLKNFDPWSMKK